MPGTPADPTVPLDELAQKLAASEAARMRLADQVKRLVGTESELYESRETLDKQLATYRHLFDLGQRIAAEPDPVSICRLATECCVNDFGFERAVVLTRKSSEDAFRVAAHCGYYEDEDTDRLAALEIASLPTVAGSSGGGDQMLVCEAEVESEVPWRIIAQPFGLLEFVAIPHGEMIASQRLLLVGNSGDQLQFMTRVTRDEPALMGIGNLASLTYTAVDSAEYQTALEAERQQLEDRVADRTEDLQRELRVAQELLKEARSRVEGPLLGDSIGVRALREAITQYAQVSEPLLLTGPLGAGQEAIARAIHHESDRNGAFIYVNCAHLQSYVTTPAPTAETDGAPLPTKFELAQGGTLYLDGVDQLPCDIGDRIVAALTSETGAVDARIIAFTSKDLDEAVHAGLFSEEFLLFLSVEQLRVPAMAERRADIPTLAEYYLEQHARKLGVGAERISDESMKRLKAYRWPGNIRELEMVVERAVATSRGPVVEIDRALLGEGIPLGHYRLVERIGEGGMGEVWRAHHQLLARPAAIKLIRDDALEGAETGTTVERFRREAKATAKLNSPNTVRLFDFGVSETGAFYYVMELLDGMDLGSLVEQFGPLPPERVVHLIGQACRSLGEAHDAGLVHRDIKPANIFVCRLGPEHDVAKVLDFGIVKAVGSKAAATLTAAGRITGTPAFMAPEAITSSSLDGRADLYSLGCVAWFLLTGRYVFELGDAMVLLMKHVKEQPAPPSSASPHDVPKGLDDLILACLKKSPNERPASAHDLWRRLTMLEVAEPWTPHRAEEWWQKHLPAAERSQRSELPNGDSLPPTAIT